MFVAVALFLMFFFWSFDFLDFIFSEAQLSVTAHAPIVALVC